MLLSEVFCGSVSDIDSHNILSKSISRRQVFCPHDKKVRQREVRLKMVDLMANMRRFQEMAFNIVWQRMKKERRLG